MKNLLDVSSFPFPLLNVASALGGWVMDKGRPVIQSLLLLCWTAGFIHSSADEFPHRAVSPGMCGLTPPVFLQRSAFIYLDSQTEIWAKRDHSQASTQTIIVFL